VTNSFLFVQQQATQTLYSYGYNATSRTFIGLHLFWCPLQSPGDGRGLFRQYDAQPPLIMSVKLRNSLATLALAFSSIAL
jgi:hypothetical protein